LVTVSRIDGPLAKIDRAREHLAELERAVQEFFATDPYGIAPEEDEEAGQYVYKITKAEHPPPRLALIAGDVTHNLRASLDLLIWQLIEANGVTPDRKDAFPITDSEEAFEKVVSVMERRISKEAVETLRAVKPYTGGNDDLWRLHHLDIADKHRVLAIVGMAYQSTTMPFPASALEGFSEKGAEMLSRMMGEIWIRPADRLFPIKVGDELVGYPLDQKPKEHPKVKLEVSFGQGEIVEGEPILETLRQLVGVTDQTVQSFAEHL
jgi:hypothetical protein